MFRRRKKEQQVEGACTFCGFVPDEPSSVCPQCYYEFDKSPRDQGSRPDVGDQADILALLEAEPTAVNDDAPVVEAVLAMDDITVDVPDFEAPAPVDEEQDVIGEHEFMDASGPTLNETKAYVAEEEATLVPTDVRADAGTFEVPDHDPMEDIAEPVPMNIGGLHSPSVPQERDEDLTGHTEPLPELPDLDAIEEPDDVPLACPRWLHRRTSRHLNCPTSMPWRRLLRRPTRSTRATPRPLDAMDGQRRLEPRCRKRPLCPFSKRLEPGNSNAAADLDHVGPHLP